MSASSAGLASDSRAASRGGLALTVLQTIGRCLGLAFVTVTTHAVGADEFGRYSIVSSLVVLATFLSDFGITPVVTRAVAREPRSSDRIVSTAVLPSFGLSLVAYGAIVCFAAVADYPRAVVVDVTVGGLAVLATGVLTTLQAALDGAGLIARRAVLSFTAVAISTLGGLVGVIVTEDVRQAMVWMAAAPAIALAATILVVRRRGLWRGRMRWDRSELHRLARAVVPFAVLSGLGAIYGRLDVLLLSLFDSSSGTATYDLALRVVEAAGFLATALTAPGLFLLTSRIGVDDRDGTQRAFSELVRAVAVLGLVVSAVLAGSGQELVAIVLGDGYERTGFLLALMGLGVWIQFIALAQGALITAGNHVRQGLALSASITAGYAATTVVAIVLFGDVGAVATLVVVQVVTVGSFSAFHRRTSGVTTPLPGPRAVGAAMAAGAAGQLVRPLGAGASLAASAGGVLLLLVILRVVGRGDLERLIHAVRPVTRAEPGRGGPADRR